MKLLVDANLSPVVVAALKCAGRTAVHVADIGLLTASDDAIFDRAAADGYVVVTADSDFPMMLAPRRAASPSVVLMRNVNELPPEAQGALLVANLPTVAEDLGRGAIVSFRRNRTNGTSVPLYRTDVPFVRCGPPGQRVAAASAQADGV